MQWVGTLQQCALWSGGSLRRDTQAMRSRPIGREIRYIWPGHILDDLEWRTNVSVEWTQVVDTLSRHHVRVAPLQSMTAPMSAAPFGLDSRVVQPRPRKVGEIWDATWVAHGGSPWWEHDPWAAKSSYNYILLQGSTVTANLRGLDVAEHRQPVGLWAPETVRIAMLSWVSTCWTWAHLPHSGTLYPATEYTRAIVDVRSTGAGAPQSVPVSLLMMLQCDLTLSRTFSVCLLYVSDLSRVTPRYFCAKSCTSTSPASVTFSFLAACLLSRWKQVATVFLAFRRSFQ